MNAPKVIDMQCAFFRGNVDRYELIAPNTYITWSAQEMDLLCVRKSGYIDEVEIKVSKADFRADFKKTVELPIPGEKWRRRTVLKHKAMQEGLLRCNKFSFLLPEDVANQVIIPEYAGLYIYREGLWRPDVREVKAPKLFHKRKIERHEMISLGRKMAYRYWRNINDQREQERANE